MPILLKLAALFSLLMIGANFDTKRLSVEGIKAKGGDGFVVTCVGVWLQPQQSTMSSVRERCFKALSSVAR